MKFTNSNKSSKAPEILWLIMSGASLFAAVHKTINHSFKDSLLFYGFVLLSVGMYFLKKNARIKRDKNDDSMI